MKSKHPKTHKKAKADATTVTVTKTKSDAEFLALACRRNASHGKLLVERDKTKMAIRPANWM